MTAHWFLLFQSLEFSLAYVPSSSSRQRSASGEQNDLLTISGESLWKHYYLNLARAAIDRRLLYCIAHATAICQQPHSSSSENPALLCSCVTHIRSVKMLCSQKIVCPYMFVKHNKLKCWSTEDRSSFSVSCNTAYRWDTTNTCFMRGTQSL